MLEIVDAPRELLDEGVDVVDQARRQVLLHAAGPEIGRMEPRARDALVELHQLLALLEAPEQRRDRADIEGEGGQVEEMIEDARDLGEEHADHLGARRRIDAQELLDRQRVGVLLAHRRDVIEPIEIRHRLEKGLVLDQLLGAAMQQPDMRIGALHHLAVHFEDEAQHAMRRRMLRPEIHREALDEGFRVGGRGAVGAHFPASSFAFSSPGKMWLIPSQGDMKSKLRNSCFSFTGS